MRSRAESASQAIKVDQATLQGKPRLGRPIAALLLTVMAATFLAGCGSEDESSTTEDAAVEGAESSEAPAGGVDAANDDGDFELDSGEPAQDMPTETPSAEEVLEADSNSPLGSGGTSVTPTAADIGRQLIFTAVVDVAVDDVAVASTEATAIIQRFDGFLFQQETTGGAQARSELTFKISPDQFSQALEALGAVGELRNQSVSADDVTERIVDLGSRIEVAELGVDRLRLALEASTSLEDYAEIERLLLDRESSLELMRAQLRTLEQRVDLATITLVLTQDRVQNSIGVTISTYRGFDAGVACPGTEQGTTFEADSPVTVCFDVINLGDQTLTDIALTDTVLGIDVDTELVEVFGSLDELAPGQSALVAYELNPGRTLRLRTKVVAIPTDGVSSQQAGPSVTGQASLELQTFEPESNPGFGDGFSAAVSILKGIWIVVTWTMGLVLPLLVLAPFVVLAWYARRALKRRRPEITFNKPASSQPPPPPPIPSESTE